ncbi:MAG: DUF1684 domain-containing protein [Bryobacterales bacterium]|nr:DUF1684 domain-containing protein [Bryobacterales bacterium]
MPRYPSYSAFSRRKFMGAAAISAVAARADDLEAWRQDREQRLAAPGGWLSVAGLFWLKDGEQHAGSDPGLEIVLPEPAPPLVGTFRLSGSRVEFAAAPGVPVMTASGEVVTRRPMRPDHESGPDPISVGSLDLFVIQRGGRTALRLIDHDSPRLRDFRGLDWFRPDPAYRVEARLTGQKHTLPLVNIVGDPEPMESPGTLEFKLAEESCRLDPALEPDGMLFLLFRDATSGRETYGAGRYLRADPPRDGRVVLDFNRTYNPPCVYTPYATCPLPPRQNRMTIAVRAGEKMPQQTGKE